MTQQTDIIHAVCFDLDGVIVDTAEWPKIICDQIRNEFNIGTEVWNDPKMRGANQIQVANVFCAYAESLTREDFLDRCNEIDADMVASRIQLRTGIKAVIEHLEQNNTFMGICTNGLFSPATDRIKTAKINGFDIASRMRFVISQKDFGDDAKPHTKPLVLARDRIQEEWRELAGNNAPNIEDKNILVIGDTDKDIIPAAALGMPSIHWPYPGKEAHPDATHIVNSPKELLTAVQGYQYTATIS